MKNRCNVVGNVVFGGRSHCSKLFMPAVGCWKTQMRPFIQICAEECSSQLVWWLYHDVLQINWSCRDFIQKKFQVISNMVITKVLTK